MSSQQYLRTKDGMLIVECESADKFPLDFKWHEMLAKLL